MVARPILSQYLAAFAMFSRLFLMFCGHLTYYLGFWGCFCLKTMLYMLLLRCYVLILGVYITKIISLCQYNADFWPRILSFS